VMTPEDSLRKQIINQLICHFHLDIPQLEKQWGINFQQYFKAEIGLLDEMVKDGLSTIDAKSIQVALRGRLLIRNVCMVFDSYLKDNVVKFSKVI